MSDETVNKTDREWRESLSPEQYRILRKKGTESPYTGQYYKHKEEGTYLCAGCGQELFDSSTKYESGCGWPSFWQELDKSKVVTEEDHSFGMRRVEVMCSRCGGHLGHVFPDGPPPTGIRFCINSGSLDFRAKTDSTP